MIKRPNTFIVGAPKCGTTAMAHYLGGHPRVWFSKLKEPGFWATDFDWLAERNALHSLDDYLALFAEAGSDKSVIGEASTMYLSSTCAVANILRFDTSARFIVMLRNPVEVAQAYHMQKILMFQEHVEDFEAAWRLQDERRRNRHIPRNCPNVAMLLYGEIARFGPQVARILGTAPRTSIHFVRYEEFRRDTGAVYRGVLRFLQLDDDARAAFPVTGPARAHRFGLLARLFHDPPAALREPIRGLRRHLVRRRYPPVEAMRRHLFRAQTRAPLSSAFRAELQEYFRPDMEALQQLLGWDLGDWLQPDRGR